MFRRLRRTLPPTLDSDRLARVLQRLADGSDDDPFICWSLRQALPEPWRAATPTTPIAAWLEANVPRLHTGRAGDAQVLYAHIGADPERVPAWCVRAGIADQGELCVYMEDFDAALLNAPPAAPDHAASFDGTLGETRVDVEIDPMPGGHAYRVTVRAASGTLLATGARFQPIALTEPDQLRRLYYRGDADGLFLGRRDGGWVVARTPDGLDDARPAAAPDPLVEAGALLSYLVAQEVLERAYEPPLGLLWEVEIAIAGPREPAAAARALEDVLLEDDAVEELFADPEQLAAAIVTIAPAPV